MVVKAVKKMKNKKNVAEFAVDIILAAAVTAFTFFVVLPTSRNPDLRHFFENGNGYTGCAVAGELSETENITSPPSVPETEAPVSAAPPEETAVSAEDGLSDLKAMQDSYIAAFAGKEPAGTVSEQFFVTNGATDVLGKIAIKNATSTKKPDFEALLNAGAPLKKADFSSPTVLIFHTHTTESYLQVDDGVFYDGYQTRSADPGRNMVRVGDEICAVLEQNGIGVIHDTNVYDEAYDGAYARSRKTVLEYLEKYPTIQIVLDVHRDAIYYSDTCRCKPTAVINGEKAAQVMIITGAEEGQITDFPNWEGNLKFALALQKTAQEKFEGLMKPVYFCQRKYNMDASECSLLLEIGSDANTLEEACRSAHMIGETLAQMIKNVK